MATSGSVDFSVNRAEIVEEAYSELGYLAAGQTLGAEDVVRGNMRLNLLVKQWQGTADFAPGLKEWSRKTAYLFLQTGQSLYELGPTGDHWTASYGTTTLSAAEALGQTILSVTSTSGMTAADNIGIELSSGALHWTTISSFVLNTTVTVATALPSAAASGARVFFYTTKGRRPLHILTAVRRDVNTLDTPIYEMTRERYEALPDKTADATPTRYNYEPTLIDGTLRLDAEPTDTTEVIRIVFLGTQEDFDSESDTPDYPQEWYLPLVLGTAIQLAPGCGVPVSPDLRANFLAALAIAQNTNAENSEVFFEPDR